MSNLEIFEYLIYRIKKLVRNVKELCQRTRRMIVGYNAPSERYAKKTTSVRMIHHKKKGDRRRC